MKEYNNTDKLYQELYPEYRDCFCVEEQLSHDEYLDKLDAKLYEQSQNRWCGKFSTKLTKIVEKVVEKEIPKRI